MRRDEVSAAAPQPRSSCPRTRASRVTGAVWGGALWIPAFAGTTAGVVSTMRERYRARPLLEFDAAGLDDAAPFVGFALEVVDRHVGAAVDHVDALAVQPFPDI